MFKKLSAKVEVQKTKKYKEESHRHFEAFKCDN